MQRLESHVLQECDIYLLDDVLAAVDASVAALLWERAICGLLRSKTCLVRPCLPSPGYPMKGDHIGHTGLNWQDRHECCWFPTDSHLLTAKESHCYNLNESTAYVQVDRVQSLHWLLQGICIAASKELHHCLSSA